MNLLDLFPSIFDALALPDQITNKIHRLLEKIKYSLVLQFFSIFFAYLCFWLVRVNTFSFGRILKQFYGTFLGTSPYSVNGVANATQENSFSYFFLLRFSVIFKEIFILWVRFKSIFILYLFQGKAWKNFWKEIYHTINMNITLKLMRMSSNI